MQSSAGWWKGIAALSAAATLMTLAGCGGSPPRTAARFCAKYAADKQDYLTKYNAQAGAAAAQQNPLASLLMTTATGVQMLGSIDRIFTDLAKVAPDDIATDVEQVRDSIKKQLDEANQLASNPLGSLVASLLTGLESSESWQRVADYVGAHCGG